MTRHLRQIILNVFTGWLAILIRSSIALLMVPFLLYHLGKEGYGLIGLLGVIVSLANVVDLGLRSALGRELSEQVVRKDFEAFNGLASSAIILYLCIATVLVIVGWVLAPWLVDIFKVSASLKTDAVWLIRIYGSCSTFLSFIVPVYTASLSSFHRFDVVNSIQVIGGICSSLMLFVVISIVENPLYGWVAVMILYQLIIIVLYLLFFGKFCKGASIKIGYFQAEHLKPLFKLGGYMYALNLTQALAERSDPLVISAFWGPSGVTLYQPGGKLSQLIRSVVTALAEQMYPLTTRQYVDGQNEKMRIILVVGTKFTLLLGGLFSACMFVFAEPFCRLWLEPSLGKDFTVAAKVMMGWAIADLIIYAAGTQWSVLLGMKKLRFLIWTQLPTAILNVLISIYLVGYTNLGIPGVLVATIAIGLIRRPILIWYTAKVCELPIKEYFKECYIPAGICCFLVFASGKLISMSIKITDLLHLVLSGLCVVIVWVLSCWIIGFGKVERGLIKSYVINKVQSGRVA